MPGNSSYFRNPRRDDLLVSAAGPASNLLMALFMALIARILWMVAPEVAVSHAETLAYRFAFEVTFLSVWVNVGLALFNLIPIPPLDGSWILISLLPPHLGEKYRRIAPYGMFVLFALFFTGAFGRILFPIVNAVAGTLLGR